ncbi:hypothetical protein CH292_27290 [Rhodococcus sp. 14-2470-1a]|nr:hypothetical protein CH292_27290 [Rhodococcus sp. 14-2470-1a]
MRHGPLQRALVDKARSVARRAQSNTDELGGEATISVVSGIRPGGRSFANVESDSAEEEHGSERKTRRRALGRAIREVR